MLTATCAHIVTRMPPIGLRTDKAGTSPMMVTRLPAVVTISRVEDFDITIWSSRARGWYGDR